MTEWSGRSLEYEKALPGKGKVFQMKGLPQPGELQESENGMFWGENVSGEDAQSLAGKAFLSIAGGNKQWAEKRKFGEKMLYL